MSTTALIPNQASRVSHPYQHALLDRVNQLLPQEGVITTAIAGLTVFHSCHHRPARPFIYNPGTAVVLQGHKIGRVGGREFHYGPGQYLLQTLPIPFYCETIGSVSTPAIGVRIDFDPAMVAELVQSLPETQPLADQIEPTVSVPMHTEMAYAVMRLLEAGADSAMAAVLGQARLKELTYEALKGPNGHALRALAVDGGHYARIARTLKQISANLDAEFSVAALARDAGMSVSGFHASFKQITQTSPIQYLKRCRLLKAQAMLSRRSCSVSQIASEVGYTSISQFSRDYRKAFGYSPTQEQGIGIVA